MTRKFNDLRRQRHRRWWLLAVTLVAATAFGIVFAASSGANLPGSNFEGGDGNLVVNGAPPSTDWANVPGVQKGIDNPSGSTDNAFGVGTKEDDPAATVVDGSIPPSKNDLTRFYAAAEFGGTPSTDFLYLSWQRTNTNGDANLDFELNQNATANFDGSTTGPVTLNRTAGDVLITYDFGGSGTPTIGVLHWLTTGPVSNCFSAHALPCWGNQEGISPPATEAAVNDVTVTDPLNGNASLVADQFGEVSINIGLAHIVPADTCEQFGDVWVKSRSSSSFSAEIKDFIAPAPLHVSNCASPTVATNLSATTAFPGTAVHDSATLTGATSDAGGTVTYTAYTDNACSTGAQSAGTKTVTNGVVPDSDPLTFTSGTYYWQASYSGDHHNNAAKSPCQSEILSVAKANPTIATQLSATSAFPGTAVHDGATLSGETSDAGGTVTYTVYTDNQCSAGAQSAGTKSVTNGVVTDSNPITFNSEGTFYWQAVYSGDTKNAGATSPCQSEILTIAKNHPTIATQLSATHALPTTAVHDSATLSGETSDAGGTVTYTVYTDNQCSAGAQSAGTKSVTNGVVTDSNPITFNSEGTFYWQAVYSGDTKNAGATSPCQSEILTIAKVSPTISTTLSSSTGAVGDTIHDSSTLHSATADAGGSVTYTVYTDNQCSAGAQSAGTKTVTNGVVLDSNGVQFNNAGTYYWQAVYTGDAKNNGATSPCQSEILTIGPKHPTIATNLSSSTGSTGDTIHDSSTLSGQSANAGGTVTYTVYTDDQCSAGAVAAGTKTVTNGVVPNSDGVQFNNAGTFYWQAVYSGDGNNVGATSPCQSEILTIGKNHPTIATSLSATAGAIGDTVHDSSTLSGASANAGGTVTYTVYTDNECSAGAQSAGTKSVTNGVVLDSNGVQFNSAGTFYWQAVYSGDGNNVGATSPCQSEILTIAKNHPSIATELSATAAAVGATVHDSSALTGATGNAIGTVTYTVYTDDQCSAGAVAAGTKTVAAGVVPDSNGVQFNNAGTFYWQAVYSGDDNNVGATSPCQSEILTIGKNVTSIDTVLSSDTGAIGDKVHDTATLSGATAGATGTAQYNVYLNSNCSTLAVAGTDIDNQPTSVNVTSGLVDNSSDVQFLHAGDFYWRVVYSGDGNNAGSTSPCNADHNEHLAIAKNHPSISTALSASEINVGSSVHDTAKLTGATGGAGGTVTYSVFNNSECSNGTQVGNPVNVDAGSVPNSDGVAFPNAGTFYWQASYSGDANNDPATSSCREEVLQVDSPAISITKNPKSQSITTGGTANFTIVVTNTGTVTLTNVTVTDLLAPGCAKAIGTLTPGQSTSYSCALSPLTASFTNSATAIGKPPVGPDVQATDTAPVTVNAIPPPPPPPPPPPTIDLAITKVGSPSPTTVGGNITWTLTVVNNGPSKATGVTVADPIPAGTTFVSATSTQGTCTGGAALSCQIGGMNIGQTVTITLVTSTQATGQIPNTATVVGNEAETNTANNSASAQVQVVGKFVPPPTYCTALVVSPKQLTVGKNHILTIRISQHGKAISGIKVRINGSTLSIVTGPSNSKGVVKRAVKPTKAGIVTFVPVAHKGCSSPRVGVIGVFTPPVTG